MLDETLIQRILEFEKREPFIEVQLSEKETNELQYVLESKNILFRILDFTEVDSKQKLMLEFEKKLEFPEYFGRNWDALFDCLRDFSWTDATGFVFVIPCLPNLTLHETYNLLDVLFESWVHWRSGGRRNLFKVIFSPYKK